MICNRDLQLGNRNSVYNQTNRFDDCTKDVLKELYVQEEEMSDTDEESAEVEDKYTDDKMM